MVDAFWRGVLLGLLLGVALSFVVGVIIDAGGRREVRRRAAGEYRFGLHDRGAELDVDALIGPAHDRVGGWSFMPPADLRMPSPARWVRDVGEVDPAQVRIDDRVAASRERLEALRGERDVLRLNLAREAAPWLSIGSGGGGL